MDQKENESLHLVWEPLRDYLRSQSLQGRGGTFLLLERFQGVENGRLVIEALRAQATLQCNDAVVGKLAAVAKLEGYGAGELLIVQNADDNRIAFILSGQAEVRINGKIVAHRKSGQHVGEMSVIDPQARRSASVVATEETCVAWVDEKDFAPIAEAHPYLWRTLALELADRLRQRGASIRAPNEQPRVFIGSSTEALALADAVRKKLASKVVEVRVWKKGIFGASEATIESLEAATRESDFAVILITADDMLKTRRQQTWAPRDNVVFELGLFMGAIGRDRTLMMVESGPKIRLPPDLNGVTHLRINSKDKKTRSRTMSEAIGEIRDRITKLGPRVG